MTQMPELTVSIMVCDQRERGEHCLYALLNQTAIQRMEILIIDFAPDQPPLAGSDHPAVRVLIGDLNSTYGLARLQGLQAARAPLIAYLEEHVIVAPDWAENVIKAFEADERVAGVGPKTYNANPKYPLSRVFHLLHYQNSSEVTERIPATFLMGQNSTYRVSALQQYLDNADEIFGSEPILNWKMAQDGHRLVVDPLVRVAHINETSAGMVMRGTYIWHRQYARSRVRLFNWSPIKRLGWLLATPLIPWVRLFRTFWHLQRRQNPNWGDFFSLLPKIIAVYYAVAYGVFVGLVFGPGDAAQRFLEFEMNEARMYDKNFQPFLAEITADRG